jgi:hypothetical protein
MKVESALIAECVGGKPGRMSAGPNRLRKIRSRPLRWGKYIMLFVYDAIDGDVGKELRKKNPEPRFLRNHHQWLKKFGRDKVHDQIERVITIMKLCNNMTDFREKFSRVFKKSPAQLSLFDFDFSK